MVRKKLDSRIRNLIESTSLLKTRSLFILVGDHGKDQVVNLHYILSKTQIKARPSVLWCYKKELGFSTHKQKRMKKIKRDQARGIGSSAADNDNDDNTADNFELFISGTDITWCYYKDSHRALGQTFGMLVLQDFETMTPNLLARTVETVEGGGIVVLLMRSVSSLKQLYTMTMDVHSRYRTEGSGDVVPRFNERFMLSLGKCTNCLVCDDELNILPLSKIALKNLDTTIEKGDNGEVLTTKSKDEIALDELKVSLEDTPNVGVLVNLAKTLDQAHAILTFLESCSEKTNRSTIALTAARGRGKSAAIGLCLAGAISFGYANIYVTAPDPENLVAVFDFILRGLGVLKYAEHLDYTIKYNASKGREGGKVIVAVEIHRDHKQVIKYIEPSNVAAFSNAELVAIDEAAAIPLPIVKKLMGNYLTFLSSTVNGYEGTGRALSLKLIKELRDKGNERRSKMRNEESEKAGEAFKGKRGERNMHEEKWAAKAAALAKDDDENTNSSEDGNLKEITLVTPIRYAKNDPIETWLNNLLCLNSSNTKIKLLGGTPAPLDCELYSVNRDALFSYHKLSETFLQKMMTLYTSAHYKNSPNDLQMLSDAPGHRVFVLLSPSAEEENGDGNTLPDILAVVQVALEGKVSRKAVEAQLSRGHRAAGDLIPWTIAQQFNDSSFAGLSGARIVRVAVHPDVQGMGYGGRAIEQLYRFYNGEILNVNAGGGTVEDGEDEDESDSDSDDDDDNGMKVNDDEETTLQNETLKPRKQLPPLLLPLSETKAPRLDWIGTSFGLTSPLFNFWTRTGMKILYLRQTPNELTGECSTIMVRALPKRTGYDDAWLPSFVGDCRRRLIGLLGGVFQKMEIRCAAAVLGDEGGNAGAGVVGNREGEENDGENEPTPTPTTGSGVNGALTKREKKAITAKQSATSQITSRAGVITPKITATELSYILTQHDLKRLDLYGRNLCDHHLITDLLSPLARLYFTNRLNSNVTLSSLQSALLCGIGLQNKSVDYMVTELNLPSNQVLAMFNKGVRKLSIALNAVLEEAERVSMFGGEEYLEEAERGLRRMGGATMMTLEEDNEEGAAEILSAKKTKEKAKAKAKEDENDDDEDDDESKSLPSFIDKDLLRYQVKGSDKDWDEKIMSAGMGKGSVQIKAKKYVPERERKDSGDKEGDKDERREVDYEGEEDRIRGVVKKDKKENKREKGEKKEKKGEKSTEKAKKSPKSEKKRPRVE